MSLKDRTNELFSAIQSIEARNPEALRHRANARHSDSTQSPLLGMTPATSISSVASGSSSIHSSASHLTNGSTARPPKSEFAARAAHIARGIQQTTVKLEKLGKLAKRRTLFDDRPVEITELTSVIKQDITSLNDQIRHLQAHVRNHNARHRAGKHEEEHSQSVVVGLQSSLARTSQGFAEVLEIRTENMKAQKERRDQFAAGGPNFGLAGPSADSPLLNFDRRPPGTPSPAPNGLPDFRTPSTGPGGSGTASPIPGMHLYPSASAASASSSSSAPPSTGFLTIDMGFSADQAQQFAVADQNTGYMDQRNTAIESIESTIAELGQIFQQLGTLVAQQHEQVRRIDDNVQDIETNVDLARKELFKYWTSVSSNRLLMVKVFAVVLVFFFLFVMFL
ncbi:t-SNARE [Catenaria anguillulae PL171]|uniref:t-SNARE n=1 Tax=Catenaria anguillulae PL171 TaxID=765915 RepID=A0A1Y2HR76_9FUNG|nr:t-SNARE [Catenaria anguillulae PL171]